MMSASTPSIISSLWRPAMEAEPSRRIAASPRTSSLRVSAWFCAQL